MIWSSILRGRLKGKNKSNTSNEMKVDPSKRSTGGDSKDKFLFENHERLCHFYIIIKTASDLKYLDHQYECLFVTQIKVVCCQQSLLMKIRIQQTCYLSHDLVILPNLVLGKSYAPKPFAEKRKLGWSMFGWSQSPTLWSFEKLVCTHCLFANWTLSLRKMILRLHIFHQFKVKCSW